MTEVFALLVGLLLEGVIRITAHHHSKHFKHRSQFTLFHNSHFKQRCKCYHMDTARDVQLTQHTVSAPYTHFIQYTCQAVCFVYFTHYNAVGRVATDYTQSQQTLKSDAVEDFKDMYMEDYKSSVEERVHIKHQHCKVLN